MSRQLLFPPLNFGIVEDGIYRSGLPTQLNLPFLLTLRLKTVICLEQSSQSKPRSFLMHTH